MVKTRGGKQTSGGQTSGGQTRGGETRGGQTRGGQTSGGLVLRSAHQQGLDVRPFIKPTVTTKHKKRIIADLVFVDFERDQEHIEVEAEKEVGNEELVMEKVLRKKLLKN